VGEKALGVPPAILLRLGKMKQERGLIVPEGQAIIAQRFNAGF
jgi:hypothetical protein